MQTVRRARTDEEKMLRRRTILDAANEHFTEVGFEAFSMAELGKRAGVAKGTLYLYFDTREAVLLALCCEKLESWETLLGSTLRAGTSDARFAAIYYETMYVDAAFLPLLSRLDSVIEHNVSTATLIDAKRTMASHLERLSRTVAPKLGLTTAQAFDAIRSLGSLLLGAAQVDAGPKLDRTKLPKDVGRFMNAFSSRDLFTVNACRILSCIRAGA